MCRNCSNYNRCCNISYDSYPYSRCNLMTNSSFNNINTKCCNCRKSNYNSLNSCKNNSVFPENYLYGYAYTPKQDIDKTFSPNEGLIHGSLFPELVSPYTPGQSMDFIDYLEESGGAEDDE